MCVRVGEGGLSENEAAVTVADIFGFIRRGGGGSQPILRMFCATIVLDNAVIIHYLLTF